MSKDDRDRLLLMNSQLIGVLTTAVQDPNADAAKLQLGSSIAQSGTQYNYLSHQDVEDLEKALKECKDNCDAVRAEFAKRDADNTARLNNCWATGDCEKIKAEIDEGSRELNKLWQNDKTGITDQFLHSNIADSTNARTRASLDHLPKGDPANAVKLLAAAGIIALAPEAIGLLGQYATRGAATCAANPVLCVNEAGVVIADLGLSEALPVGLGAAAGSLTTKELSDLRALMEIEAKTGAKLTADEVLAVVRPAASGAKGEILKTEKYFRVEGGGAGSATSQNRITANADGSISINPGCTGQLCVSVGNADHASYYLTNKRPDGSVVVFDVDAKLHKEIMANAIPQRPVPGIPRDPTAPKIVDPSKPGTALELPQIWESLLEKNSSNARVYSQEAFLKEFGH
ncbi:hypothetical protein D3C81_1192750 [compost metagenome]